MPLNQEKAITRSIPFVKMEGIGNDYVYINDSNEEIDNLPQLAKNISNRHFGVGSDGLIAIRPSEKADFYMRMFNLDGSEGKMCGNGIRCFAKLIHDEGLSDKKTLTIETLSGIKTVELLFDETDEVTGARVDMGKPSLNNSEIPIDSDQEQWLAYPLTIADHQYKVTGVSMGNPHIVTYLDEIKNLDLTEIGPLFEYHQQFPEQINTEFIKVISPTELDMRVWERGSGETLACGTGACAAVVSSILNELTENKVSVNLLGGRLVIEWDRDKTGKIFMEGPARTTFKGEYYLKE